jgi:hypothetical protein
MWQRLLTWPDSRWCRAGLQSTHCKKYMSESVDFRSGQRRHWTKGCEGVNQAFGRFIFSAGIPSMLKVFRSKKRELPKSLFCKPELVYIQLASHKIIIKLWMFCRTFSHHNWIYPTRYCMYVQQYMYLHMYRPVRSNLETRIFPYICRKYNTVGNTNLTPPYIILCTVYSNYYFDVTNSRYLGSNRHVKKRFRISSNSMELFVFEIYIKIDYLLSIKAGSHKLSLKQLIFLHF